MKLKNQLKGRQMPKKGKRIIYNNWSDFESGEGARCPIRKHNLPIVKHIHDLILELCNQHKIAINEVHYGGGTFSFRRSPPLGVRKTVFASVGLLSLAFQIPYIRFWIEPGSEIPAGAIKWSTTRDVHVFRFETLAQFDEFKNSVSTAIVRSYEWKGHI